MDAQSFIEAIWSNPRDEVPRLVYADWLDDQGDPRGELIRIQCEIARRPNNDLERKRLQERADELLEDYGESWLEPLRELGALGVSTRCFHRGLLEQVKISADGFLKNAEVLCQLEPALARVQLVDAGAHFQPVAEKPFPPQITELDLSANRLAAADCRWLKGSPLARQLKSLDLKFNQLDDEAVLELFTTSWPELERLDLFGNRVGSQGCIALAGQDMLPRLKAVVLSMNQIQDDGVVPLAQSESLKHLEELHLASNRITERGARSLMDAPGLPSLKILNLRYNRINPETQQVLKNSQWGRGLQRLDLTGSLEGRVY